MKTLTPSSRTSGQETKYRRLVEDAAKKAVNLVLSKAETDQDGWQRILEHGDELCHSITEVIVDRTRELSLSDQFVDEEVESTWIYPKEYKGSKPIEEQIKALALICDGKVDPSYALAFAKNLPDMKSFVPADALEYTGWFAIMSPPTDPEKYCGAVQLLHGKIAASRRFYNYREGQIDKAHLRVHPRTVQMTKLLAEQQQGEILIIAAQLGLRHRGRSTRRAREVFVQNEFGLTSAMGCSIALTHPERFVRYEELDIDLPGDEFDPDGGASFGRAPCLDCGGGEVRFGAEGVDRPSLCSGSASGFVPQ
ncbi:MAG: Uncharacterized protein CEN87_657 [Parcubacteria group bacterium Licking1014_1]|nr:MAG: Uncharacterized protein CEN87_657 [Parcubacteria group bacterium Licking1014_1]